MASQVVQNTVELLHAWKTPAPMKQRSKNIMFMHEAFQIILKYSIEYRRLLPPPTNTATERLSLLDLDGLPSKSES